MIIALLTDFGTKDYFVGAMKGVILSINEAARIVDITHDVPPQDLRAASFTLRACYRNFPKNAIFAAIVDPGVGSNRRAILVETGDYYFIAPDNGLLSFVFDAEEDFRVFELTNRQFFAAKISRTFHGRDVFAPAAGHLSKDIQPAEFGAEIKDFVRLKNSSPKRISDKKTEAEIIHIDRFGNLVINLTRDDLPEKFTLEINGKTIDRRQTFFAEAEKGEIFSILGSAGFLEIVAFKDSAEKILRVASGEKVYLKAN